MRMRITPVRAPAALRVACLACLMAVAVAALGAGDASAVRLPRPKVLRVGRFEGKRGKYKTIQAAVNAANPGDWILIGPGDYKEAETLVPPGDGGEGAGAAVLVTKPGIHIRGMSRNGVVLDGTKPGTPKCSANPAFQGYGPLDGEGRFEGRNGLVVYKVAGVSVENLTACNYLTGAAGRGNQIWFNNGDGSGVQTPGSFRGAYLSATSTFWEGGEAPFASYGIFASNSSGPGMFTQDFANNQADSAFYVGACADCNTTLDHAHAENSDLGYSGTNSGGHLLVQNSEFDNNQSGFVTNSQNNDDAPSPQDGKCPNAGETGPTGTGSCWVFTKNAVHDNNNPNVPTTGSAEAAPVGAGVVIAGGRDDTITENTIYNNGSWGVLLAPYPDTETPPPVSHCQGGTPVEIEGHAVCYYDDFGNEVTKNTFTNNGFFGNVDNVDAGELSNPENPGNCWHENVDTGGEVTSAPALIQSPPHSTCGIPDAGEPLSSPLGAQVACATGFFAECPSTVVANYPKRTEVAMAPLPEQTSMPNPCLDVPKNPWCPGNAVRQPVYPVPGSPAG
jgi:hypothetical protein